MATWEEIPSSADRYMGAVMKPLTRIFAVFSGETGVTADLLRELSKVEAEIEQRVHG